MESEGPDVEAQQPVKPHNSLATGEGGTGGESLSMELLCGVEKLETVFQSCLKMPLEPVRIMTLSASYLGFYPQC